MKRIFAPLLLAATLANCGGDGSPTAPTPPEPSKNGLDKVRIQIGGLVPRHCHWVSYGIPFERDVCFLPVTVTNKTESILHVKLVFISRDGSGVGNGATAFETSIFPRATLSSTTDCELEAQDILSLFIVANPGSDPDPWDEPSIFLTCDQIARFDLDEDRSFAR